MDFLIHLQNIFTVYILQKNNPDWKTKNKYHHLNIHTMKKNTLLLLLCCCASLPLWATSAGNLKIVQSGTSSAEPKGGWYMGIGERGKTYTLTASAIATLLDSNDNDLTLCFDTIFIDGNVNINRSGISKNQYLQLMTNDYRTGAIVFMNNATLTVTTANKYKSFVTLSCDNIKGFPQITATEVTLSNVTKSYQRIEMNGFTNWHQWEIDSLLAHADKVGPDIGNGAYDFTNNTRFSIDSNHVFSMKAQTSFQGKKMGFKNMDRGGTLLPDDYSLGAYPDSFYVDLSKADGIRFKVELQGSASSFNIGLSNCLKKGQWHEHCFEYYVYNIPFSAVDKDGYVTLPFSMFERVSWSGEWDLSILIVFIMEVSDAANNTVVSFSDVHGYTIGTETVPTLTVGNLKINGALELSASNGFIRQLPGTRIEATSCDINSDKNVILDNPDNNFGSTINLSTPYAYLQLRSKSTGSTKYDFNASSLLRYDLYKVWADNVSQGVKYNYSLTTRDTLPHSYEICYNSSYFTIATDHEKELCEQEEGKLVVTGDGKASQYHWFDKQRSLGYTDTLAWPSSNLPGKYRVYVELDTQIMGKYYHMTQSANIEIHPSYNLFDTVTICASELPYKWNDTLFAAGTTSGDYTFYRNTVHGCDSITILTLTVNPVYAQQFADSVCAGTYYTENGFQIQTSTAQGGQTIFDTIPLTTVSGCDSICYLQLYLYPQSVTEITDTVKKGVSYMQHGFNISGTEIGTEDFSDTLTNANGCDSIIILHLTTIINDGIANISETEHFTLYPNPAKEVIRFRTENTEETGNISELRLTDLSGRQLRQIQMEGNSCDISLNGLAAGCYYLSIYNTQHQLIGVMKVYKK